MSSIEYASLNEEDYLPNAANRKKKTSTLGPFPMRTSGQRIFYSTGLAYLTGISYGTLYGTYRGLMTAKLPNFRVRMNAVVNQVSRYGTWSANSLAVMAMQTAIFDGLYSSIRGQEDSWNAILGAFTSGFVFKSTAGIRSATVTGALLASAVGSYVLVDNLVFSREIKKEVPLPQ
ncbi:Tim17/Tim22/Tim23/Pmp24 family-domain-containing protein [Gorgonomyces haynaldii]|nr:Tim17/Tim22/Tim23/Pmp24 family-domain-containing protein [Gorgonomyces haynaldii]